jgi:hypothetical protein
MRSVLNPGSAFALIVLLAASASATPVAGPIVNPNNGHSYYLLNVTTWTDAEAQSVALGGHLATIRNQAEQNWVFGTFGHYAGQDRSLLIGLNDTAQKFTWVWASGEPVTYTNWVVRQPDNSTYHDSRGQDYVMMVRNGNYYGEAAGGWNDIENGLLWWEFSPYNGVAEVLPEPSSLLMLAVIAALRGVWR